MSLGRIRRAAPVLAIAILLALAAPASSQQVDEGYVRLALDFYGEYDDNVTLGSGIRDTGREAIQDDFLWRLVPTVELRHASPRHTATIDLDADIRRGTDTDLNEENFTLAGTIGTKHPSGFELGAYGDFVRATFDTALFFTADDQSIAEAGVSESNIWRLGGDVRYTPKDRLSFAAGYAHRQGDYDFGDGQEDKRNIDRATGRVVVPFTREWVAYGDALWLTQDSRDRPQFVYDRQRYVGGARWEGPNRFVAFAEVGVEEIDFEDTPGRDFDEVVALGGVEAQLTEETSFRVNGGRDGYGEPTFEGIFTHDIEDDQTFVVSARRSTENSFSDRTINRIFESTVFTASWEKIFQQRFTTRLSGRFFRLEAEQLDFVQVDKTGVFEARVGWLVNAWLEFGGSYRWAQRTSNLPENEFTDNRGGGFIGVRY